MGGPVSSTMFSKPTFILLISLALAASPTSSIPAQGDEFVGPFPSWINVKTVYGAVADGTADDTAASKAADLRKRPSGGRVSCEMQKPAWRLGTSTRWIYGSGTPYLRIATPALRTHPEQETFMSTTASSAGQPMRTWRSAIRVDFRPAATIR